MLEDEINKIDDNDVLIEPFREFQKDQIKAQKSKEYLYSMIFSRGIEDLTTFTSREPYIFGLMEKTLPDEYKKHNDIFREYYQVKKHEIALYSPILIKQTEEARKVRQRDIVPFMRKNYNILLMMFGGEVKKPTPKKTSDKPPNTQDSSPSGNPKYMGTGDLSQKVGISPIVLDELDPETGEMVSGEVLGKVGGKQDLRDKFEELSLEEEDEANEKQLKLKKCYDFLAKRLDFYIQNGIDLNHIALCEPFVKKTILVNDILEDVKIDAEITDLTGDEDI